MALPTVPEYKARLARAEQAIDDRRRANLPAIEAALPRHMKRSDVDFAERIRDLSEALAINVNRGQADPTTVETVAAAIVTELVFLLDIARHTKRPDGPVHITVTPATQRDQEWLAGE